MRFHPNIREAEKDDTSNSRRNNTIVSRWSNSDETGQYLSAVVYIQRTWRWWISNQSSRCRASKEPGSKKSSYYSDKDETSETDSYAEVQMMSLSTPDDGESKLKIEEDLPSNEERECRVRETSDAEEPKPTDRKAFGALQSLAARCAIDSEPESIVSDYSEMADPIKEHLANVQIIQKEDLDMGNTFVDNFLVQPKIFRGDEEDEEEFNKRLRKTNYLSLAQEFAELKKVNASALPFGLHKDEYKTASPLSDGDSESDQDYSGISRENSSDFQSAVKDCSRMKELGEREETSNGGSIIDEVHERCAADDKTADDKSETRRVESKAPDTLDSIVNPTINKVTSQTTPLKKTTVATEFGRCNDNECLNQAPVSTAIDSLVGGDASGFPDSPGRVMSAKKRMEDSIGEFDIYTVDVETALPQMDWQHLEEQLQKAAEEEQRKWSHCGDREQIRRKLAMPAEEDGFDSDRLLRKPSLQTRLQTNMNLQMCFVNEAANGAPTFGAVDDQTGRKCVSNATPDVIPVLSHVGVLSCLPVSCDQPDENEDFFAKQARLQAEAKMALAQVRPMAHMQLQLEKQLKKKSPLAEIVGIPGFFDGKFRLLGKHLLHQMNFAQIQVFVNDLHAQIEVLNTELMQLLVERDDLHMAQDSMLVDIEDLTGRAQEFAARVNKRAEKRESCLK